MHYALCTMQANLGRVRQINVASYHNEFQVSHIVCSYSCLFIFNNKSADIFLTCQESERASFRAHQKLVSPFFQPPAIFSQICSAKSAESTSRGGGIFQGRGLTSTQYELLPMLQTLICKASTTHLRTFSGKSKENGIACKKSGLRC